MDIIVIARSVARPADIAAEETYGFRLRRLRTARGWSRERLAEAADVAKQTVQDHENERGEPFCWTLARFADALSVTMQQLYRGEDAP